MMHPGPRQYSYPDQFIPPRFNYCFFPRFQHGFNSTIQLNDIPRKGNNADFRRFSRDSGPVGDPDRPGLQEAVCRGKGCFLCQFIRIIHAAFIISYLFLVPAVKGSGSFRQSFQHLSG